MKRKSNPKQKEFTAQDIKAVADGLDYSEDQVRRVARGIINKNAKGARFNKDIENALYEAKEMREKIPAAVNKKINR